jgi:hypothetical protein
VRTGVQLMALSIVCTTVFRERENVAAPVGPKQCLVLDFGAEGRTGRRVWVRILSFSPGRCGQ